MGKCCCLVFIAIVGVIVLGLAIGIPIGVQKAKEKVKEWDNGAVENACKATSYPGTCNATFAGDHPRDTNGVTRYSVKQSEVGVNETLAQVNEMNASDPIIAAGQEVCMESLQSAVEDLERAGAALTTTDTVTGDTLEDVKAWVSAAMEMHTTCIDAFRELDQSAALTLEQKSARTNELLSNALAFVNALADFGDDLLAWRPSGFSLPDGFNLQDLPKVTLPNLPEFGFGNRRRLLSTSSDVADVDAVEFPKWMDAQTRRHLLQASDKCDVVVAKDGSGKFGTIQAAVDSYKVNNKRVVICIKAGVYAEQVIVPKKAKYLTFVGDGADLTVITGKLNVALMQGMTTFKSGTLIVTGEGFICKSLKVENTAGSLGHQAVAFRGSADFIAFYKVTFDSYQDTLYCHSLRHFYRECNILGTVDFIFGNGAASFQSCNVIAKKSQIPGQQNTYTAQGRTDPHQRTGLSFQNCKFDATPDLKTNAALYKSYLGRPWKPYSVCVIMKSEIFDHIDPSGWLPWNTSDFGLYTSYFTEYQSYRPNSQTLSDISKRVKWSHQITDAKKANYYHANTFSTAKRWVPTSGIPLTSTL